MGNSLKACSRDALLALQSLSDHRDRKIRSTLRRYRWISRLDSGRLRFFHPHLYLRADRQGVRHVDLGDRAHRYRQPGNPLDWRYFVWSFGGPLWPARSADRQYLVLLGDRSSFGPGAELHHLPRAAPAVRHRHGWRMGRGRVVDDGVRAGEMARDPFGLAARGVRARVFVA